MFILLIAFFICGISVVNFQYNPPKTTCQIGFLLTFELPWRILFLHTGVIFILHIIW